MTGTLGVAEKKRCEEASEMFRTLLETRYTAMKPIKTIAISVCYLCAFLAVISRPALSSNDDQQEQQRGVGVQATERRIALVIGNADYTVAPPLGNPVNDARDMAEALKQVGFEVISGENLSQQAMDDKIRQFGGKLREGGVGLFYYAGHGMQAYGENYLIPVDADIRDETEVKYKTVHVGLVLGRMEEAKNRLNIVILDACRDNPYRSFARSSSGGLAGITAARGQIYISYATATDSTAADGDERNGLFTGELLEQIKRPGLTLQKVFMNVRFEVSTKSGGKQVPFEYNSMVEEFYFVPPAEGSTGDTPKQPPTEPKDPPKNPTVSAADLLLQAETALKRNDADKAKSAAEDALKIESQNSIAHRLKGEACFGKRIRECWGQEIETTLQLAQAPRNAREYEARAWANRYKGNLDQALIDLNESLRLDSKFAWAYYSRGNVFMLKREIEIAIADYTQAISLESDAIIYYQGRASAYAAARNYDLAIADYSKAISLNSNDVGIWRGRASMYQAKKDYTRAVEDLTRVIGLDPTNPTNYSIRGNVRRELNQTDLAISDYSQVIQLNPKYCPAYGERAKLYRLTGRIELAEADEKKAADLCPGRATSTSPADWITQAEDKMRHRRFDEALRIAEDQLAKDPRNAVAIRLKTEAVSYVKPGDSNSRSSGIQTVLQMLTGKALRDAREFEARAWALYMNKARIMTDADYDLVIADCNEATRLDSRFDRAYVLRGSIWQMRKLYERAIADFSKAIELYPNIANTRRFRANLYRQKGDYDSAIADLTAVIGTDATISDYSIRGDLYSEKGDYRNAIVDYTSAIKLKPDFWQAYERRAQAYRNMGLVDRAVADERKAQELKNPTPPTTPAPRDHRDIPIISSDKCKQGFVWREARASDHVCVTPQTRAQTAEDNRLAASRIDLINRTYRPNTCKQGFVWREAFPGDVVCVTPQTRAQAAEDNRQAATRRAQ